MNPSSACTVLERTILLSKSALMALLESQRHKGERGHILLLSSHLLVRVHTLYPLWGGHVYPPGGAQSGHDFVIFKIYCLIFTLLTAASSNLHSFISSFRHPTTLVLLYYSSRSNFSWIIYSDQQNTSRNRMLYAYCSSNVKEASGQHCTLHQRFLLWPTPNPARLG